MRNALLAGCGCLCGLFLLSGCAGTLTGSTYSRDEARKEMTVSYGTVVSVRDVVIEGTPGVVGGVAGAAAGAAVGRNIGSGLGRDLATVGGAIGGAVAGAAIEKGVTKKQGVEITVKLDSGRDIVVVQEKDRDGIFAAGDRVRVVQARDGTTRVSR